MHLSVSLRPSFSLAKEILLCLLGSVVIALFAKVKIFLPFTPVPIVLQSHIILLFAVLFGSRRAVFMVAAFLLQGFIGLPVFSGASGLFGPLAFVGPTSGYLIGYLFAAFLTGWWVEKGDKKSVMTTLVALILGNGVLYFFGVIALSFWVGGIQKAFILGVLPFLMGDLIKLVLLAKGLQLFQFGSKREKGNFLSFFS